MHSRQNATSTGIIWEKRSPLQFIFPPLVFRGLSRGSVFGKRVSSWCLVAGCMCHFGLVAISRTSRREATGGDVCVCVCVCVWQKKKKKRAIVKTQTEWIRASATMTENHRLRPKRTCWWDHARGHKARHWVGHDVGVLRWCHTLGPLRRPARSGAITPGGEKEKSAGERGGGDWQREERRCGWRWRRGWR